MRGRATLFCILALLLLTPSPTAADVVVPRKGKPIRGRVRRAGDTVFVNPYFSTVPEMTWGVIELSRSDVREIRPETRKAPPSGREEVWDGNAALRRDLGALLVLDSAFARRDQWADLRRRHGVTLAPAAASIVEHLARSWRVPRGVRHDVPLRSAAVEGATFSIYVPEAIHPLVPVPVVVGLHGGLHRTKEDGRFVFLGTARDVFALLEGEAKRRGWLLVCPNATHAPWNARETDALIRSVLREVEALYPVDRSRRYLWGFGAGADGAFVTGAAMRDCFAAVGGACADDPGLARKVAGRRVPVCLYHGETSDRTPAAEARKAADALRTKRADFAYLELPEEGHGFPRSAEADAYRFFADRARTAAPDSSLTSPPEEDPSLGAVGDAWADLARAGPPAALLERLRRGGWDAEAAARGLLAARPSVREVGAILAARTVPVSGRQWAAWLLGRLGDPAGVPILGDAVRSEPDPEVRRAAIEALRLLGPEAARGDLWQAFEDALRVFTHEARPQAFASYRQAIFLAAAAVETLAQAGADADALLPAIEEGLLIGVLKNGPVPPVRAELGEDVDEVRARLARAVGRAYRTLDAEATLLEMLPVVLRGSPALLRAAHEGYEEGVAKGPGRGAERPRWD